MERRSLFFLPYILRSFRNFSNLDVNFDEILTANPLKKSCIFINVKNYVFLNADDFKDPLEKDMIFHNKKEKDFFDGLYEQFHDILQSEYQF